MLDNKQPRRKQRGIDGNSQTASSRTGLRQFHAASGGELDPERLKIIMFVCMLFMVSQIKLGEHLLRR